MESKSKKELYYCSGAYHGVHSPFPPPDTLKRSVVNRDPSMSGGVREREEVAHII